MEVIYVKDYEEMSQKGFEQIKKVMETKESPVVSLNTGGTPKGLFQYLVEAINQGLDISDATIMSLDEYIGPKDAVYTVRNFMNQRLFNNIEQQPKHLFLMDGSTDDVESEIKRYKELLATYPRDIQLLGLGTNAHLGANEPGTPFDTTMFLAEHHESTIQSTMKEYGITREEAPTEMLTLGLKEIAEAETVLLLVSGKHKAQAVKDLVEGDVTPDCPASVLRNCENAVVIVDEDAASLLTKE
ncbi:6-phosphogluconolactonase [Gracilibacillus phocaeensis]|uniref:6-phosphogluconolactonase n=1 Tax=Gracilibacillus phocaeensis TaxID=2042304 RepID=UPI0010314531|nr:glucosamine-6-phosphate deaminase [Gracilibacillus phocaeensis]